MRSRTQEQAFRRAVGQRIRQARVGAGWRNASQFAQECGFRPTTLWRYETGKGVPSGEAAAKIAKTANVSSDWIWGQTDNPSRAPTVERLAPALTRDDGFAHWLQHGEHPPLTQEEQDEMQRLNSVTSRIAGGIQELIYEMAFKGVQRGLRGEELRRATEYSAMVEEKIRKKRKT